MPKTIVEALDDYSGAVTPSGSVVEAIEKLGAGGGGMSPAAVVPNSDAEDVAGLVADYNGLLAALRTAGIIASS